MTKVVLLLFSARKPVTEYLGEGPLFGLVEQRHTQACQGPDASRDRDAASSVAHNNRDNGNRGT